MSIDALAGCVFLRGLFHCLCRLLLYFVAIGLPTSNSPVDCLRSMLENEEALSCIFVSVPYLKAIYFDNDRNYEVIKMKRWRSN